MVAAAAARRRRKIESFFKKASELSILFRAEVAAVVFSPGGKAYSFGHPSVESLVDRFLSLPATGSGTGRVVEWSVVVELNRQYGELRTMVNAHKARRERAEERMAEKQRQRAAWMDPEAEVDGMAAEELVALGTALVALQGGVAARAHEMLREALLVGRRPPTAATSAPPGF